MNRHAEIIKVAGYGPNFSHSEMLIRMSEVSGCIKRRNCFGCHIKKVEREMAEKGCFWCHALYEHCLREREDKE